MDMKAIRSLAEIMKENSLTRVEIVEEGKTIRMEREARLPRRPLHRPDPRRPYRQPPL